jgi:putative hemolysin
LEPDPLDLWQIFIFALSFTGIFFCSLIRNLFPIISRNFDAVRDQQNYLIQIHQIAQKSHFIEIIVVGRTLGLLISTVIYWELTTRWTFLFNLPRFVTIYFFLHFFGFFLPRIIAQIKPYSLARISYLISLILWFFLEPIALLFKQLQNLIYKLTGYDNTFSFLTEKEQNQINDTMEDSGESLENDEKKMIRNIIEYGETLVSEVMTPRVDMLAIPINSTLNQVTVFLNRERHSRIPVYSNSIDNIIGVLHAKDILKWISEQNLEEFDLKKLIRPPFFVANEANIDRVMNELRMTRNHMAIVLDEYGGTDGLITLEDILEEIVGDILDEDDEVDRMIYKIQPHAWIADASISIYEVMDEIKSPLEIEKDSEIDTLAGYIQATLGENPRRGHVFKVRNIRFKILKMQSQRIVRVLIEKDIDQQNKSS